MRVTKPVRRRRCRDEQMFRKGWKTPVNQDRHGKWTSDWRRISYWKWGIFQAAMLVYQRVLVVVAKRDRFFPYCCRLHYPEDFLFISVTLTVVDVGGFAIRTKALVSQFKWRIYYILREHIWGTKIRIYIIKRYMKGSPNLTFRLFHQFSSREKAQSIEHWNWKKPDRRCNFHGTWPKSWPLTIVDGPNHGPLLLLMVEILSNPGMYKTLQIMGYLSYQPVI